MKLPVLAVVIAGIGVLVMRISEKMEEGVDSMRGVIFQLLSVKEALNQRLRRYAYMVGVKFIKWSKMTEKENEEKPEPEELSFKIDEKMLTQSEIVKVLKKLGSVDLTSTMIRDALKLDKETGRDKVRSIMERLTKEGVVKVEQRAIKEGSKRRRYYYSLMEAKA